MWVYDVYVWKQLRARIDTATRIAFTRNDFDLVLTSFYYAKPDFNEIFKTFIPSISTRNIYDVSLGVSLLILLNDWRETFLQLFVFTKKQVNKWLSVRKSFARGWTSYAILQLRFRKKKQTFNKWVLYMSRGALFNILPLHSRLYPQSQLRVCEITKSTSLLCCDCFCFICAERRKK